jgi:hypothetical protein
MLFKKIGLLWLREDDNNEPYYFGELDLGVFGRVRIGVYIIKKKEQPHDPDGSVHVQLQEYQPDI